MRSLNPIEHSFTLIDNFYPFNAVVVLKLKNGPKAHILRSSLNRLQLLHPLLKVAIKNKKDRLWFEENKELKSIPLNIVEREGDNHWERLVRYELNNGFDLSEGPLVRVNYLISDTEPLNTEIILTFHHAIIDAETLLIIADEILKISGNQESTTDDTFGLLTHPVAPDLKSVLPKSHRGIRLYFQFIPFIFRQIKDEILYKIASNKVKDSKIPENSENNILTLTFDHDETSAIIKWSRKKRTTINSILSAAMLVIVNQFNYKGEKLLLRAIQFGNLRPYLISSVQHSAGGCFVSLFRFSVRLQKDMVKMATFIDKQYLNTSRRGDKFIFALIGKFLMKTTIKARNARLGNTALSYAGHLNLGQIYGNIQLTGLHGFITNNCLGAEFTGFAKIFQGKLSIDLNFLTAETSREKAEEMTKELKKLILKSAHTL